MVTLGDTARSLRPDVTHCLHFPTPVPALHPLVTTLHDLTPLLVAGVMESGARRWVYRRLNERAVRIADALVTPSAHTARDVERVFPRSVGKTRVVPEAADDFSAGEVGTLPEPVARLAGAPYVLSMGSTRPQKDLPTLIEAFALLVERGFDTRLVLVGVEVSGYLEGASGAVPADHIIWTGRVTDEELRALYASAAVFAFPSIYEGFGLPPLEAMAMGAPVVVSDASSLPEVVGDAAVLVPPGDALGFANAIARVLDDDVLRTRLVTAGAQRASELTWDAAAEATVAVYREAMDALR
jgi:glycosyltransferase involved in cell wall biosynthesis